MSKKLKTGGDKIRCPHCLAYLQEDKTCSDKDNVQCGKCGRTFTYRYRITTKTASGWDPKTEPAAEIFSDLFPWLVTVVWVVASFFLTQSMKGPAFLFYYAVSLVLILVWGKVLFREEIHAYWITYVGIGLGRIIYGASVGMHKFDFLLLMMTFGTIFAAARSGALAAIEGSSGWSSGGCGSSCGGGCGGGCGGCGS